MDEQVIRDVISTLKMAVNELDYRNRYTINPSVVMDAIYRLEAVLNDKQDQRP
jgi:hypothetical protein